MWTIIGARTWLTSIHRQGRGSVALIHDIHFRGTWLSSTRFIRWGWCGLSSTNHRKHEGRCSRVCGLVAHIHKDAAQKHAYTI